MSGRDEKAESKEYIRRDQREFAPLPPRPGSALSRPNSASRSLAFSRRPDDVKSSSAVIQTQIEGDHLLRILKESKSTLGNDALVAAESGDLDALKKVMASLGDELVDVRGMGGYTVLHHACNRGHAPVVNELLSAGFPINIRSESGESPLHLAVYVGNLLIVEQLIDNGADIDCSNNEGESPLFYAARRSFPAVVRLLLQRGADSGAVDRFGECALDHADDRHTQRAFDSLRIEPQTAGALTHSALLEVFGFLNAKEICRCACVSGKWHRVSESEILWIRLGIRRWECALQSSLGFSLTAMTSFRIGRPPLKGKPKSR